MHPEPRRPYWTQRREEAIRAEARRRARRELDTRARQRREEAMKLLKDIADDTFLHEDHCGYYCPCRKTYVEDARRALELLTYQEFPEDRPEDR